MPKRTQEFQAVGTNDKDKQIAVLRQQLETQAAQITILRNRLTSTLNTMDTMRRNHEKEITSQQNASARSNAKLERLVEYTSTVERERDECRDAVLELIQKVEQDNEPSAWPHSRMRLTSTVEPAEFAAITRPGNQGLPARASLVITSLRAELEKERVSHTLTHSQAEREIRALRSEIAQMGARLQELDAERDRTTNPTVHRRVLEDEKHMPPPPDLHIPLSPEDALKVLAMRAAKNKELELEIRQLASKLEKARLLSTTELNCSPEPPLRPPSALPALPHAVPHSPALRPYSPDDILSPYSMTPRNAATPHTGGKGAHPRSGVQRGTSPVKPAVSSLELLEQEIKDFAAGIDNLKAQRRATKAMVAAERRSDHSTVPPPRDVDETSSQATAVPSTSEQQQSPDTGKGGPSDPERLQEELRAVKLRSAARENELLGEIECLREALRIYTEEKSPSVPDDVLLWEDHDREESMELGTPLAPTAPLLWGSDTVTVDPQYQQPGQAEPDAAREEVQRDTQTAETGAQPAPGDGTNEAQDISLLVPLPESPSLSPSPLGGSSHSRSSLIRERPPTPFAFDSDEEDESPTAVVKCDVAVQADRESLAVTTGPCITPDCSCLERIQKLEYELKKMRKEVADRDVELVELRRLVTEARLLAMRKATV